MYSTSQTMFATTWYAHDYTQVDSAYVQSTQELRNRFFSPPRYEKMQKNASINFNQVPDTLHIMRFKARHWLSLELQIAFNELSYSPPQTIKYFHEL